MRSIKATYRGNLTAALEVFWPRDSAMINGVGGAGDVGVVGGVGVRRAASNAN